MAITAGMVKELREMTGAGMMDCKKALTETNGDMDAAVEVLRKSGAAKMEKKQSRIAAEGIARVAVNGNVAVVAEVNSETDFVAKNETFQEFVQTVADTALASGLNGGALYCDFHRLPVRIVSVIPIGDGLWAKLKYKLIYRWLPIWLVAKWVVPQLGIDNF